MSFERMMPDERQSRIGFRERPMPGILAITKSMRRLAPILSAAMLGSFVGCNAGSMEAKVSGTVTLDGNKIGPGMIVFAPADNQNKPATGSVESDGSYTLMTSRESGLAAGTYKVALSIREMPQNVKRGDRPPLGKSLIPEKYEESATSGLEYEVNPGPNTINIELKRN